MCKDDYSVNGSSLFARGETQTVAICTLGGSNMAHGSVKFLKAGVFYMSWAVQVRVAPPIPVPTPSFNFGLWKNGVLVPGSTVSGYTQAPGDNTVHINGEVTIAVAMNDEIKLRNAESIAVDLDPNTIGIQFPVTASALNVHCLKVL